MKYQQFIAGILLGLIVGALVMGSISNPERYSIHIFNQGMALRLDKRTGQTWKLVISLSAKQWIPIPTAEGTGYTVLEPEHSN